MGYINPKKTVTEIFYAALKSADPYESVKLYSDKIRSVYKEGDFSRLILAGFGKASCPMAKALGDSLPDILHSGIIVTKYGHVKDPPEKIQVFEAGHPVPDENGLKATESIIKLLKSADMNTLSVCLVSGGGSALLVSPHEGITLDEKQKTTHFLLKAGADIHELNTVRKHISRVKGGRLAEIAFPSKIISLILSDVIGDKLDVIASGPTSPDTTTYDEAINVIGKYRLTGKIPHAVMDILVRGREGITPDTPKQGNRVFEKVENIIIGSNSKALEAAKKKADSSGLQTEILSNELTGEAGDVGRWLAKNAKALKKERRGDKTVNCVISGGETTVTVKGNGLGGRNTELALTFAMEIEGVQGITLLSAGTDGTDGPTDAAGAIVDGQTIVKARNAGLDPSKYLEDNDSYSFFKKTEDLLITGPTGTNVMDLQILVIE
ncbi:MAG: glycerate kinase [Nitrospirota bacterium]